MILALPCSWYCDKVFSLFELLFQKSIALGWKETFLETIHFIFLNNHNIVQAVHNIQKNWRFREKMNFIQLFWKGVVKFDLTRNAFVLDRLVTVSYFCFAFRELKRLMKKNFFNIASPKKSSWKKITLRSEYFKIVHILHMNVVILERRSTTLFFEINFRSKFEKWLFFKFLKNFKFWPKIYFSSPIFCKCLWILWTICKTSFLMLYKYPWWLKYQFLKLLNLRIKISNFKKRFSKLHKRLRKLIFCNKYTKYELRALK